MIKDIEKIVYDRLSTASEYLALSPKPLIFQEVAEPNTNNPVIIINSIGGRSNKLGVRIETIQLSAWANSKDDVNPVRNALAEIFNRWKSADVEYSYLSNSKWAYDRDTREFGLHMTFVFKIFDSEY